MAVTSLFARTTACHVLWDYDRLDDASKARRFGFHAYVEAEAMRIFNNLHQRKIIPG
jgi:hypothetical protein